MSIEALKQAIMRQVGAMLNAIPQPRWGIVTSVDPTRPAVKVLLQPEGAESGWLSVAQAGAGSGWTMFAPISPGSLAFAVPETGARGADYVVVGFAHNDAATPPLVANANGTGGTQSAGTHAVAADEILMVHHSGSVVRLTTAGGIYLRPASGTVMIDGNLVCNGDVSDRHGSLDRLRGNYDAHVHGGVQGGGSSTSTTSAPDSE